jgi:KDO2-lipid IV(A) lauroyltransferase
VLWSVAASLVAAAERAICVAPRRLVDGVAVCCGLVAWHVLRVRRKVVLTNLRIAYPEWTESTRNKVGRASVISLMRTCFEFLDAQRLMKVAQLECQGEERLDGALAKGQGVYILCCHLGNWELMCQYGAVRFKPVHVVVKPVGKGPMAQLVEQMRARRGMNVIRRDSDRVATMGIFRALRDGHIVGFMADQRRSKGLVVPFFGRDCHTNASLVQLWQRKPAPIVPVSLVRTGFDRFRFVVWPELAPDPGLCGSEDGIGLVRAMNEVIEKMVDARPEQYFWMHRRWKGFEPAGRPVR